MASTRRSASSQADSKRGTVKASKSPCTMIRITAGSSRRITLNDGALDSGAPDSGAESVTRRPFACGDLDHRMMPSPDDHFPKPDTRAPPSMIVSFDAPTPTTVYRTVSSICDVLLAERGATMAQLDRTDLAVAEAVELLFVGGSVVSARVETGTATVAIAMNHDGPNPKPGRGTEQLLWAAFATIEYDEHVLRLRIEIDA